MSTVVMLPNVFLAVSLAALAAPMAGSLAGCDGSGHSAVEPATAQERDAARSLVGQIAALTEQPTEVAKILQAADFSAWLVLAAPSAPPTIPPWGSVADNALADCLLATSTAATLTECELGDHIIEGTWSVHYQRAHAQLVDVFVDGAGQRGSSWIDANVSLAAVPADAPLSANTLDGLVEVSLMWTTGGHDRALDARIRIEGLVVEGPDCATAGAVTIDNTSDGSTTALWFGPTCRDVHISRQTPR